MMIGVGGGSVRVASVVWRLSTAPLQVFVCWFIWFAELAVVSGVANSMPRDQFTSLDEVIIATFFVSDVFGSGLRSFSPLDQVCAP